MTRHVDPLLVLKARAGARATLFYRDCEYPNLEEAIKPLRVYALHSGIVDLIGSAAAMKIIYAAFDLPPDGDVSGNPRIERVP